MSDYSRRQMDKVNTWHKDVIKISGYSTVSRILADGKFSVHTLGMAINGLPDFWMIVDGDPDKALSAIDKIYNASLDSQRVPSSVMIDSNNGCIIRDINTSDGYLAWTLTSEIYAFYEWMSEGNPHVSPPLMKIEQIA